MKAHNNIRSLGRKISFVIIVFACSLLTYFLKDYSERNQKNEVVIQNPGNLDFKVVTLKSSTSPKKLGSVIMDLEGSEMSFEEVQLLQHPNIAGILLSKKNIRIRIKLRRLSEIFVPCGKMF